MLSVVEARVLGSLLEKQRTVPDQYPLTLNALASACNQSQSRDPVMQVSDHEIEAAITTMKANGLARLVHPSHGRSATRYRQVADEQWSLEPDAAAVIALLLLRGPQTVAELRSRTERLHPFDSLDDVQRVLEQLAESEMVRLLERQPGQKELRWQQLVAEEVEQLAAPRSFATSSSPAVAAGAVEALTAKVEALEARITVLEAALADLL